MGNLYDGDRVFDAVADTDASSTSINELQDQLAAMMPQLKAMIGPWEQSLLGLAQPESGWAKDNGSSTWSYDGATYPGDRIQWPLPFFAGQILKEVYLTREVVTNGTTGDLKLLWRTKTPSGGAMPAYGNTTLQANVWNGITNNYATLLSITGLSVTLLAGYEYMIDVTPRTSVSVCKVHALTAVMGY